MKALTTDTARLHLGQNYAGHSSALIQPSLAEEVGGSTPAVLTLPAPRPPLPVRRPVPLSKAMRDLLLAVPAPVTLRPVITPPEPLVPPMVIDDLDLI